MNNKSGKAGVWCVDGEGDVRTQCCPRQQTRSTYNQMVTPDMVRREILRLQMPVSLWISDLIHPTTSLI